MAGRIESMFCVLCVSFFFFGRWMDLEMWFLPLVVVGGGSG